MSDKAARPAALTQNLRRPPCVYDSHQAASTLVAPSVTVTTIPVVMQGDWVNQEVT